MNEATEQRERVQQMIDSKIGDHAACVKVVQLVAGLIDNYDVVGAIERAERALHQGALLDPTLWREKHVALEQDIQALRSVVPLVELTERFRQKDPGNE